MQLKARHLAALAVFGLCTISVASYAATEDEEAQPVVGTFEIPKQKTDVLPAASSAPQKPADCTGSQGVTNDGRRQGFGGPPPRGGGPEGRSFGGPPGRGPGREHGRGGPGGPHGHHGPPGFGDGPGGPPR